MSSISRCSQPKINKIVVCMWACHGQIFAYKYQNLYRNIRLCFYVFQVEKYVYMCIYVAQALIGLHTCHARFVYN